MRRPGAASAPAAKPLPPIANRYSGAKPVVDTGSSATKAAARAESRAVLERKKGELFERVGHSRLASEVRAKLEGTALREELLLLDTRQEEDFSRGHVATATSYPLERLSRANAMTLDLLNFMGKDGRRIVVYDVDEIRAAYVANNLWERGGTNTWMLAEPFGEFAVHHPDLVDGEAPPPPPRPKTVQQQSRAQTAAAPSPSSTRSPKGRGGAAAAPGKRGR